MRFDRYTSADEAAAQRLIKKLGFPLDVAFGVATQASPILARLRLPKGHYVWALSNKGADRGGTLACELLIAKANGRSSATDTFPAVKKLRGGNAWSAKQRAAHSKRMRQRWAKVRKMEKMAVQTGGVVSV